MANSFHFSLRNAWPWLDADPCYCDATEDHLWDEPEFTQTCDHGILLVSTPKGPNTYCKDCEMCGCTQHYDSDAECTCICKEHANFEVARKMAMDRYDEIVRLRKEIDLAHQRGVEKALAVFDEFHKLYPNTATCVGGFGGAAITSHCAWTCRHPENHQEALDQMIELRGEACGCTDSRDCCESDADLTPMTGGLGGLEE